MKIYIYYLKHFKFKILFYTLFNKLLEYGGQEAYVKE